MRGDKAIMFAAFLANFKRHHTHLYIDVVRHTFLHQELEPNIAKLHQLAQLASEYMTRKLEEYSIDEGDDI